MSYDTFKITEVKGGNRQEAVNDVIQEESLNIIINGQDFAAIMRTPISDKELSVGFLYSEGLIKSIDDIQMIDVKPGRNTVSIKLKEGIKLDVAERAYEVRSSCGICGQKRIDDILFDNRVSKGSLKVKYNDVFKMPALMENAQELSRRTRGAHAAAFFTADAALVACFEDVGRHNAFDKLIGHCLMSDIDMTDKVLLLSGRTSYEMLTKAIRCGVPVIASISAPSNMAVNLAKSAGIALSGIIRGDSMKVYSRPEDFIDQ